ncbi:MAG: hypothetical protein UX12_C0006G0010 [Candidatus Collierbacteria bacterium GW2011_GWC1_45_47]|uniref:Permease n=6 Tax=Candidatus Collieribacteriota TaxID=1752725 RepID=A0A0G1KEX5_9BACT|nr:MAG: hypothetical protein UW23_C0009G0032 [Candidatus Collierbacteria bacterium GW2011_GWA1_44_12]KKT38811.1 MAG: hypothetical protein UW26_C0012G0026 [Candidatus Collierbacteria bacterium GW2011_GWF1_44_12]KKT46424.1 MAG: hypothetical protein UW35_C0014G0007 [Candidatus Collierbacteria bacterium GW2011_GWF2_44_15]KKT68210.1 MAG: hypothetical protein UW62_C0002G0009 [Candidatus Collierbacteria bacterium GW2011_GWB1_44_35]KKU00431.1 MAG: hypothetical protein UW99_C0001G0040 [Candidatus Collie
MNNKNKLTVEIGFGTIFWALFAFLAVKFLGNILDIFILLFISIIIALALCPLVDSLEKRQINRSLSSILILTSILTILVLSAVSIIFPLIEQTENFIVKLPSLIERIYPYPINLEQINGLNLVPGQVYRIAIGTFSGVLSFFTVMVISFYIIKEMHNLNHYLEFWFGKEKAIKYHEIVKKLEQQIGYWVRGELALMLIVGVLSYIGYMIIGLPYTIALGVIAGLLELVPNIGPTIATIPAAIVGFSISTTHGLAAIIVSIIVQQLENNFIVPKVMQKSIGLNPLITILGLMIGYRIGGPLVAVISLPLILSARVIISHIKLNKNTNIPELD